MPSGGGAQLDTPSGGRGLVDTPSGPGSLPSFALGHNSKVLTKALSMPRTGWGLLRGDAGSLLCPLQRRRAQVFVDGGPWQGGPVSAEPEFQVTFHPSSPTGALCPSLRASPPPCTEVELGLQPAVTGSACWSLDNGRGSRARGRPSSHRCPLAGRLLSP